MKIPRKPALSICIPTYNRAMALDRLLGCIISLPDGVLGEIEICVSDNCSKDNTQQVASEWAKKLPLRYGRNKDNLGFDRNVLAALSMAKGDFAWIMSDDDLPMPGSLAAMLDEARKADKSRIGAIYALPFPIRNRRIAAIHSPKEFSISDKDCPGLNITFIGSICLNMLAARGIIKAKIHISKSGMTKAGAYPHLLDGCIHSYLFLECVSCTGNFMLIPAPCIKPTGKSTLKVSHEHRFYVCTVLLIFPIEMWKAYPWFQYDTASTAYEDIKDYFILAALSVMRPRLNEIYLLDVALYRKYFQRSNKHLLLSFIGIVDFLRSIPIFNQSLVLLFLAARLVLGSNMTDKEDNSQRERQLIAGVMERARKALED